MSGELLGHLEGRGGEGAQGLVRRFLLRAVRGLKCGERGRQGREASALAFLHWTLRRPHGLAPGPSPAHPPFFAPRSCSALGSYLSSAGCAPFSQALLLPGPQFQEGACVVHGGGEALQT